MKYFFLPVLALFFAQWCFVCLFTSCQSASLQYILYTLLYILVYIFGVPPHLANNLLIQLIFSKKKNSLFALYILFSLFPYLKFFIAFLVASFIFLLLHSAISSYFYSTLCTHLLLRSVYFPNFFCCCLLTKFLLFCTLIYMYDFAPVCFSKPCLFRSPEI